jgi:hypothetical protein
MREQFPFSRRCPSRLGNCAFDVSGCRASDGPPMKKREAAINPIRRFMFRIISGTPFEKGSERIVADSEVIPISGFCPSRLVALLEPGALDSWLAGLAECVDNDAQREAFSWPHSRSSIDASTSETNTRS